jgi:hypothetical protein
MAELTMVVPNLVSMTQLAIRDPSRWPVVNSVMARSQGVDSLGQAGAGFARALGLPGDLGGLARYCYLHDTGRNPDGGCARLDPVELGVGPRGLFLASACMRDLHREEADALIMELAPLVTEFGWHLEAPVPSRWYVISAEPLRAGLGCPVLAEGESLTQRLAGDQSGREWAELLNEIQILLHNHPVNQKRLSEGRSQANCLWPWGGGAVASLEGAVCPTFWSDGDPLLSGIARTLGKPVLEAASLAEVRLGWLESSLISLAAVGSMEERLDTLENRWLAPLATRLVPPFACTLCDLDGYGFRMGLVDWWFGWRRKTQAGPVQ